VSLSTVACGGSSSNPTSPPAATLFSSVVNDATGDTQLFPVLRNGISIMPVVPIPPDLLMATVIASSGNLEVTVSFAAGTLSHTDSFFCAFLDTDESATTGNPSAGGDVPLGFDYSICAVSPRGSTTAQVSRLSGGTATGIGSAPATFVSPDQLRVVVPLALLGNDDGRMAFKVNSMQWMVDTPVFNTGAIDWMPDLGRAAGLLR
jgi:hypothetical protein